MAEGKLSQAEIDALLASMGGGEQEEETHVDEDLPAFDFRRPSKFAREHLRSIESAHEVFARRAGSLLTQALRSVVHLEALSTDQITYEDYTRSIPSPSVMTTFDLPPLPGPCVVEMSAQMGLTLLDRLLGGMGTPVPMRRPTELESSLLLELMGYLREALQEALEPLEEVTPEINDIEFNPQFVQAVAPTEMVLMLTFQISMQSQMRTEGLLSICYPFSTLAPAMGRLESHAWHSGSGGPGHELERPQPMRALLPDVTVPVRVQLRPSRVPAVELACLRPGDVLRLEHRIDEPARAVVGGQEILRGRLGRTGRRLAIQVSERPEVVQEVLS